MAEENLVLQFDDGPPPLRLINSLRIGEWVAVQLAFPFANNGLPDAILAVLWAKFDKSGRLKVLTTIRPDGCGEASDLERQLTGQIPYPESAQ